MVTPINKKELGNIPRLWDETIEAFNELLQEKWDGKQARITQDEAVDRILDKFQYIDAGQRANKRAEIFKAHQLDIENLYRNEGFRVEFDKPGWDQAYTAYWIFS